MAQLLARLGPDWHVRRYRTQNHRTLCAQISDGHAVAIAKCRLETDGKHHMEKEAAAMSRAYAACRDAGNRIAIPRPIAHYTDLQAVVMSEIPGVSLEHALKRRWNSRAGILRATGAALAAFHEMTGCVEKTAPQLWHENTVPPSIRAACESRAEHIWADDVLDAYLGAAARTREDPVPFGFTHEDLAPRNVLVDRFDIGFIDFENSQKTHCLNDLARLALGIQIQRGLPHAWRRGDRLGLGFEGLVLDNLSDGYNLAGRHEHHFATISLRAALQTWQWAKRHQDRRQSPGMIRDRAARLAERIAKALR